VPSSRRAGGQVPQPSLEDGLKRPGTGGKVQPAAGTRPRARRNME
jgi:hypothetical protein